MNSINIGDATSRRFLAALEWCGEGHDNLETAINCLINKYIEDSGLPVDVHGEPIQGVLRTVEFVYDKGGNNAPKWRTVHVTEEEDSYIMGYENGQFKCFSKSKIVGNKIIEI